MAINGTISSAALHSQLGGHGTCEGECESKMQGAVLKAIKKFSSSIEAELAAGLLKSHGLNAEVRGSREYATHILGGDVGHFELIVEESHVEDANGLLKETEAPIDERVALDSKTYFKRAVMTAVFGAIVLPIVFNLVSVHNLLNFWKTEKNISKRNSLGILIIVLQIPGIVIAFYLLNSLRADDFIRDAMADVRSNRELRIQDNMYFNPARPRSGNEVARAATNLESQASIWIINSRPSTTGPSLVDRIELNSEKN